MPPSYSMWSVMPWEQNQTKTGQEKKTMAEYLWWFINAKILNKNTSKPNPARCKKDYTETDSTL